MKQSTYEIPKQKGKYSDWEQESSKIDLVSVAKK